MYAIQNSEPGLLLLREWSKLKLDPNASVCFDIPGGSEKRKQEATDLEPLRFNVAPADTDADADAEPEDCRTPAGGKAVCWRNFCIRLWAV